MAREGPAAESDQTGLLDRIDDRLRVHLFRILLIVVEDLLTRGQIDLEKDRLGLGALGRRRQTDPLDDPGRGGVHGHREVPVGTRDRLAAHHLLADFDQRDRGFALVLGERNDQLGRERQAPDRLIRRQLLMFERMDAVIERRGAPEQAENSLG